jgi:hypothetical protein
MSPLLWCREVEEDEELSLDAVHIREQLEKKLSDIGKTAAMVDYIGGDNASVNKKLASDMNIPFVGCASNRLNLVKLMTDDEGQNTALITKDHEFMKVVKNSSKTYGHYQSEWFAQTRT